jgi:hypothetical protein
MAIKLTEHAVYIDTLKTDMVPLSIAIKAVEEAAAHTEPKLDEAMDLIKQALSEMNNTVNDALKDD